MILFLLGNIVEQRSRYDKFLATTKPFEGREILGDKLARPVWHKAGNLNLVLPAKLIDTGAYRLIPKGIKDASLPVDVGEYHFRVKK